MFGQRTPDVWRHMEKEVQKIDRKIDVDDDLPVRMAMETVRSGVLLSSMPMIQKDVWDNLFEVAKYENVELMRRAFNKSGLNKQDLLDFVYIADQLAFRSPVITKEYRSFFRMLARMAEEYRGVQLDEVIKNCFGASELTVPFKPVDRHLIALINEPFLIKERLEYYAHSNALPASARARAARKYELRQAVNVGMEKLDEVATKFTPEESEMLIILLRELDLYFEQYNVPLIESAWDKFFLSTHLQYLLDVMDGQEDRAAEASGNNGVISALIPKVNQTSLIDLVNSFFHRLYDERLKALSYVKDAGRVEDRAVLELMLDSDRKIQQELKEERQKVRDEIREKGILGDREKTFGGFDLRKTEKRLN